MNWEEADLEQKLRDNPDLKIAHIRDVTKTNNLYPDSRNMIIDLGEKKRSKYNVSAREDRTYNGVTYHSKKEALQAAHLDYLVLAGEISFWIRQVSFIVGNDPVTKYVADFMTFEEVSDLADNCIGWDVAVIEVKGAWTAVAKRKVKLFKKKYPNLKLEIV